MTSSDEKNRNDVIEFVTILYGASWRERLAKTLGTTRSNLDHWMTAQRPLPDSIVLGVVNQMKLHVESQRHEIEELDLRLTKLRRQIATPIRRADSGSKASEQGDAVPPYRARLHVVDSSTASA